MTEERVLVAMSGGVDSSVAAVLLQQQGYTCAGCAMRLCTDLLPEQPDPAQDARQVAKQLGMDFFPLEAQIPFRQNVVEPFICAYEAGQTPNPCIRCNRHLKFSWLLEQALAAGYTHIATGHYAQIRWDEDTGRYLLYRAADSGKDQSYFLACLNQYQLAHTLFPLGGLTKTQVRNIALSYNLVTHQKRDSQDICFIPDGDYVAFMERYTGKHYAPGTFLDAAGKPVGTHRGAVCYTLGQRKGLGLAMGAPVYVCSKDMQANTVTVGPEELLFSSSLVAKDWNWIPFDTLTAPVQVQAKVRYRHTPQEAVVYPMEDGCARVEFIQPQRAITPGQSVVLYQGDLVVGSGTIIRA